MNEATQRTKLLRSSYSDILDIFQNDQTTAHFAYSVN